MLSWLGEARNRMKASNFSDAQKAFIIKQGEGGTPVAEICHKAWISQATFYNSRTKFGGMEVSEAKRLKQLEEENAKLKKLLAESVMDVSTLREMLGKNF